MSEWVGGWVSEWLSSLSCQCGPKELPKPRHSAVLKKNAAVDPGLCESD